MATVNENSGIPEFTAVVAVDVEHLEELRIVWPTWRAFRPEILASPMLVLFDSRQVSAADLKFLRSEHQNLTIHGCRPPFHWPQRERMLSLFVQVAPFLIDTPYFLKLDTDCLAAAPGEWLLPWWFDGDPVFISSPWSYSKPADTVQRLDDWGDGITGLKEFPRLNIPFDPAARLVRHRRIISFCYLGRTDWHRQIASLIPGGSGRMPVPSQDGYCWFCAERTKQFYRTVKMSRHGWRHVNGLARLKAAAAEALAGTSQGREVVA